MAEHNTHAWQQWREDCSLREDSGAWSRVDVCLQSSGQHQAWHPQQGRCVGAQLLAGLSATVWALQATPAFSPCSPAQCALLLAAPLGS